MPVGHPISKLDQECIGKIRKIMSIPEENVFTDKDVTPQRMKTRYMQLMKTFKQLDEQKIPHLLIVYCGGYGITQMD